MSADESQYVDDLAEPGSTVDHSSEWHEGTPRDVRPRLSSRGAGLLHRHARIRDEEDSSRRASSDPSFQHDSPNNARINEIRQSLTVGSGVCNLESISGAHVARNGNGAGVREEVMTTAKIDRNGGGGGGVKQEVLSSMLRSLDEKKMPSSAGSSRCTSAQGILRIM